MSLPVSVVRCEDYSQARVEAAMEALLQPLGGLSWVRPKMRVAVKVNLVAAHPPKDAATTHPQVVCALVRQLVKRGAQVVVGDSPGGLFNAAALGHIYDVTGMREVEDAGAALNETFTLSEVPFPEGQTAKSFAMARFLTEADAVINVCKLKTHGMMGMSAGVKNLFGAIAGTNKLEYHFRYAQAEAFAGMLLDLNACLKPRLTLCDAVVGMEGNGPTKGTPKQVGLLLASPDAHALDLCCAYVMGLDTADIPTLDLAIRWGLLPKTVQELDLCAEASALRPIPFTPVSGKKSLQFEGKGLTGKAVGALAKRFFRTIPVPSAKQCTGCGHCARICPAKAIRIQNRLARIDRSQCIRCFCCQEFCPTGAMTARRTAIARLAEKI